MANYWAIAIGINQYQLFQPLRCAQADAEGLQEFLVQQAGYIPQRCLLMTDTSPAIDDRSTYPTKDNILMLLEDLAAACWQPQDHLWLSFSGYGVNYNGRDYLMPVDGNPHLIEETGIEMRSLMQCLQLANLNVLLLFDINRATGTQGDHPVGKEIIELAEELQLATIISCQPEQFAQESRELGHGIFTGALLSALRSGYASNLTELENHLSILTPELSQHYWRPTQNPIAVIPFEQQEILPPLEPTNTGVEFSVAIPSTLEPSEVEPMIFSEENFAVAFAAPALGESPRNTSKLPKLGMWGETQTWESNGNGKSATSILDKQEFPAHTDLTEPVPDSEPSGRFIPNAPQPYISRLPADSVETPLWRQFLLWGGGTLVVVALISIVLLRNQVRVLKAKQTLTTNPTDSQVIKPQVNPPTVTQVAPLNSSQSQSTAQIAPISESKTRNQAVLDLAKMSLRQTQASDLSLAIATAKKIKPGEPLYEQAQENIQIWSQMILDLAEGRAKQRQYAYAIAAAQLISKDQAFYPKAKIAIDQWRSQAKQFLANQTLIDAANALIKPGQASTYNRAIEVAKKVPPGQPGSDLAEKSINQWSEKILDLAKNRADQDDFQAAIATATLVPEGTAVYEDAQEAIRKWLSRKKGQ